MSRIRRTTLISPGKTEERAKGRRVRKNPAFVEEAPPKKVRSNPANLSEDDADYLYYLRHKHEKRHSLTRVMREAGYDLER